MTRRLALTYAAVAWLVAAIRTTAALVELRPWRHEPTGAVAVLAILSVLVAPLVLPLRLFWR